MPYWLSHIHCLFNTYKLIIGQGILHTLYLVHGSIASPEGFSGFRLTTVTSPESVNLEMRICDLVHRRTDFDMIFEILLWPCIFLNVFLVVQDT